MATGNSYFLGINSNDFFLRDNKKAFILGLNVPKVTAYELKHMQSRVAELQVSLQQGSSDEKTILEENSRMNLRGIWT